MYYFLVSDYLLQTEDFVNKALQASQDSVKVLDEAANADSSNDFVNISNQRADQRQVSFKRVQNSPNKVTQKAVNTSEQISNTQSFTAANQLHCVHSSRDGGRNCNGVGNSSSGCVDHAKGKSRSNERFDGDHS